MVHFAACSTSTWELLWVAFFFRFLIQLLTQEKANVQQFTREMIAYAQWKLSARCAPLAAAKNTSQDTTTWLLRHRGVKHDPLLGNFLSDVQTCDVELILSGAVWTSSTRAHSQIPDSRGEVTTNGWCRHSSIPEAIEDSHLFWQFPAVPIRERCREALLATSDTDHVPHRTVQQMSETRPRCFQCCGIAPDLALSWSREDPDGVGNAPDPPPPHIEETICAKEPPPPRPPESLAVVAEHWFDIRLRVWSGGACANQAEPRRRRAGWALFYGPNHPWNHSRPLQGYVQTSDRAELQGIVAAVERHTWSIVPMDLSQDNLANVESACRLRRTPQIPAQTNVDSWQRLQRCAQLWVTKMFSEPLVQRTCHRRR